MNIETIGLPIVVLLPFFGAMIAAFMSKFNRLAPAWSALVITLISTAVLSQLSHFPFEDQTVIQSWAWIESIGLEFAFRLDGLGLLFAYLILVIGLLVIIYARYYISSKDSMGRFYSYLLLFMGSMLGIVLSENVIQLVIFWELTSLSSFLLISYWQHKNEGREGAKMALTITGAGGLAMLGGILLLGHIVGSYNLSDILVSGDLIKNHAWYTPIIILFLLGVFTKSAQFPFHFWLPNAMSAPTPVSAYLHSATMVKAGIFPLARFFPALSGTKEWIFLVSIAGILTLLIGAFTALFKHDLKGLLAYSTISHLGLITLLFGFSTPLAAVAAIFHIINHATFKASLFMVAGIIDHETGTRDMRRLSGLWAFMPHTATLAMVSTSAMAGVPLLNGFLSKEMFFERALEDTSLFSLIIPFLAVIAGIFSVAYSIRFIHDVFFNGKLKDLPRQPHEAPLFMRIPVNILVIICFAVGTIPMFTVAPILAVAVMGSLQSDIPTYSLAIWHGISIPLIMSFLAFFGGIIVYLKRENLFTWYEKKFSRIDARVPYFFIVDKLFDFANDVTKRFDNGALQSTRTGFIIGTLILGTAGFFYSSAPLFGTRTFLEVDWITMIAALILIIAAIFTALYHHQRFIAVISIGVVGLIVSLIFIKFSAPDLALTQLSVEVVTIVLLLLALYYLPQITPKESSKGRLTKDATIAILSAVGVFVLTLSVLSKEYTTIGTYFLENALTGGGGTNVVNVILVDFRGFDTLGEITVLAIAGLGIFAMLQELKLFAPTSDAQGNAWSKDIHPPIMQTLTRLILPLMLMVAIYIFIRGHNLPGGGFIAGLIAAIALIVQYLSNGIEWTQNQLRFHKHTLIYLGLFNATFTGVMSMFLGYPFLTSAFTHLHWPIIGEFEIASAIAFDVGVFLVVVGSTVKILVQLAKLSLTSHSQTENTLNQEETK
jgi:multicomponent K+:H+ antiporter subunit A